MRRHLRTLLLSALIVAPALHAQEMQHFESHYENVLGTTLDLSMYAPDMAQMEAAAEAAVAEIARMDAIFSNYRADSEVMRLNRERMVTGASQELLDIVELCAQWERQTQKRFSCKLGRIIALWNEAERTQQLPDRMELQRLALTLSSAEPSFFRGTRTISLPEPIDLELSGIATGYIVDRVLAQLRKALPDAVALKVDIGGDAIYWGQPPLTEGWRVGVANPMQTSDGPLLTTLTTNNGRAITASGHANRFRTIGGQQFSHIFDPTTGWPVENGIGVVAVASSAVGADVAATSMTLQTLEAAAAWSSTMPDLDALVIDAAGSQAVSDQWKLFVAEPLVDESTSVMTLNYTLPSFRTRGSYYRPYIAIWLTDARQALKKNLLLLGQDQRWARENTRWWRAVGRSNPSIVDGTARPTRAPGEYRLVWDGLDEKGAVVPAGDYILHIEAARQDGGHNYHSLPFKLGIAATLEFEGEGELGRLILETLQH